MFVCDDSRQHCLLSNTDGDIRTDIVLCSSCNCNVQRNKNNEVEQHFNGCV